MTTKTSKLDKNGKKKNTAPRATGLAEEIRESAKAGQHTASHALHEFQRTVNGVIPEVVDPLRTRIVDAAIELADDIVTAQFKFHRSIVQIADRALSTSDDQPNAKDSHGHD